MEKAEQTQKELLSSTWGRSRCTRDRKIGFTYVNLMKMLHMRKHIIICFRMA